MKKYSEIFKISSAKHLKELKENEFTVVKNKRIENVRDLVKILGISSYSIYKWFEDYGFNDFSLEEEEVIEPINEEIEEFIEIPKSEKELFGLRFLGWFAKANKIPNYSRMTDNQLRLSIGLELIRKSGLIDFEKIIAKINGDIK